MANPYGIKFKVLRDTIVSSPELNAAWDSFKQGSEHVRKWDFRTYVTPEVATSMRELDSSVPFEVMFSLREINPGLPDLVMVHLGAFNNELDTSVDYDELTDWQSVLQTELVNSKTPVERVNEFFVENPGFSLTSNFEERDEAVLRTFIEEVFHSDYDEFKEDMKNYAGFFSGVRNDQGELVAMVHAFADEFNGIVHYELDHAVSSYPGSASIATIGLIGQILNSNRMAVITTECKVDKADPAYATALKAGLAIPRLPGFDITLYSEHSPSQLIRGQVTVGDSDKYYNLLLMALTYENAQAYYPPEVVGNILKRYTDLSIEG